MIYSIIYKNCIECMKHSLFAENILLSLVYVNQCVLYLIWYLKTEIPTLRISILKKNYYLILCNYLL